MKKNPPGSSQWNFKIVYRISFFFFRNLINPIYAVVPREWNNHGVSCFFVDLRVYSFVQFHFQSGNNEEKPIVRSRKTHSAAISNFSLPQLLVIGILFSLVIITNSIARSTLQIESAIPIWIFVLFRVRKEKTRSKLFFNSSFRR